MSEWKLVKYDGSESSRRRWNEFVLLSRNATFLHLRDYMDYHADRFADCRLCSPPIWLTMVPSVRMAD